MEQIATTELKADRPGWAMFLLLAGVLIGTQGCSEEQGAPFEPEIMGNRAPIIADLPDTSAAVGDSLALAISAYDPDGEPIFMQLTIPLTADEIKNGYKPRAGVAPNVFWFVAQAQDFPLRQFRIVVLDDELAADTTDFSVHVHQ